MTADPQHILDLMLREAETRLQDAEILSAKMAGSDSAYLLRLLAFELLLKALVLKITGSPSKDRGHKYVAVFKELPEETRSRLVGIAKERSGPMANLSDVDSVLAELGSNFVSLRYPYEKYVTLTKGEYDELGRAWERKGAPSSEATFRYHPEELFALTYALRQELNLGHR